MWPNVNKKGFVDCTNLERKKYNLDADMCEAYKTDIMRKYKFPVWEGELFAPEQLQSDKLAMLGYKIRWYNEGIYICEYQDIGLTKGNWDLLRKNKMGYAMLSNMQMITNEEFKEKFKAAGQHIALSIVAGYPSYILQQDGYYKVQVGAFEQLGNAVLMEQRLRKDGYQTLITTR